MRLKSIDELIEEINRKQKEFIRKYRVNPKYIVIWQMYSQSIANSGLGCYSGHFKELYLFGMKVIWTIKEEAVEVY